MLAVSTVYLLPKGISSLGWICVMARPLITANGIHELAKARFGYLFIKKKERAFPAARKKRNSFVLLKSVL